MSEQCVKCKKTDPKKQNAAEVALLGNVTLARGRQ